MMSIASLFTPDSARYEGVRPINIWLLRLNYFLMAAFVATSAWQVLLGHQGEWTPMRVLAWCVWATYPTMAILGLVNPLRMIPILLFTIGYKSLWLALYAYPAWQAGRLTGGAAEMASSFLWLPLPIIAIPWGYVWRTYVLPSRSAAQRPV